jgi:hypothetical protein
LHRTITQGSAGGLGVLVVIGVLQHTQFYANTEKAIQLGFLCEPYRVRWQLRVLVL